MAFTKSEAYQPFVKHISTLLSGPAYLHHVHFRTPFAAVASAPVTEMLTMYFKPTISYAQQEEAEKAVDELVAAAQRHASGFKGAASGWAVELIKHESLVNEIHEKGMAFLVALGWESVDAHMAFRETKEFKRYIEPLRDIAQGMEMVRSSHIRRLLACTNGNSIMSRTIRMRKRPRHEQACRRTAKSGLLCTIRVMLATLGGCA